MQSTDHVIAAIHQLQRTRYGMEPRDDSYLTRAFANGRADPEYATVEDVAQELYMVNRIYQETLYDVLAEETMRLVAQSLVHEDRLLWGDAWAITRRYVPSMLKMFALRQAGVHISPEAASSHAWTVHHEAPGLVAQDAHVRQ